MKRILLISTCLMAFAIAVNGQQKTGKTPKQNPVQYSFPVLPDQPNVDDPVQPTPLIDPQKQLGEPGIPSLIPGTWSLNDGYGGGCTNDCNVAPYDNAPDPAGCTVLVDHDCDGTATAQLAYKIPIVYTIVNDCGGNTPTNFAATLADIQNRLDDQLEDVNQYFAANGIPFYLYKKANHNQPGPSGVIQADNSTRVITDAQLCSFGGTADNNYADGVDIDGVMNVYVAEEVNGSTGCNGFAFLPTSTTATSRVVMQVGCYEGFTAGGLGIPSNPCVNPDIAAVFIHEIGHYFGLYHTHHPYEIGDPITNRNECPDGSNGCIAGDFIADTDADPNLSDPCVSTSGCNADPSGCASPCGTPYPAVSGTQHNIMSYNNLSGCRTDFTDCQKAKMVDALLCVRYASLCDQDPLTAFTTTTINASGSPYLEICLGDAAPTFEAKDVCYNWYDAATGGTLLTTGMTFTPPLGVLPGELDNNTPGLYTFYIEEINSYNLACRIPITVHVSAEPGVALSGGAMGPVDACVGGSFSFEASGANVGDPGNIIGWYFSDEDPTTQFTIKPQINTAIFSATNGLPLDPIGGNVLQSNTGSPFTDLTGLVIDCSALTALGGDGTYFMTPFVAVGDEDVVCTDQGISSSITYGGAFGGGATTGSIGPVACNPGGLVTSSYTISVEITSSYTNNVLLKLNTPAGGCGSIAFPGITVACPTPPCTYTFSQAEIDAALGVGFDPEVDQFCVAAADGNLGGTPGLIEFTATVSITYTGDDAITKWNANNAPELYCAPSDNAACFWGTPIQINCFCSCDICDGSIAMCTNNGPQDLISALGGTFPLGGTWSPPLASGTSIFDPTIDLPGTYTYSAGGGSCVGMVEVSVSAPPTPTIIADVNPICQGESVTFTAGGGGLYEFFISGVSQGPPSATNTFTTTALLPGDFVAAQVTNQIIYDGTITDSDWGSPISTSAGGPGPGFGAGHEINALYVRGDGFNTHIAIAGNVQDGNRILLFIDSEPGGYADGDFGRSGAPQGIDDFNSGTTFDPGFLPDHCLVIGTNPSQTNFFFDLYTLSGNTAFGGGPNNFLGDISSPNLGASPANGTNTQGFELTIPNTDINYTAGDIKLMAMYISDGGFLSNQFLQPAGPAEGNYGGGPVTFSAAQPDPINVDEVSVMTAPCVDAATIAMTVFELPPQPIVANLNVCEGDNTTITPQSPTGSIAQASWNFDTETPMGGSSNPDMMASDAAVGSGTTGATYPAGNGSPDAISTSGWSTGALDLTDWFEFCVTATTGTLTVTDISFDERRSGTGIRDFEVRVSTDGFASSTTIGTQNVPDNTSWRSHSFSSSISGATTVCFRLYGFNSESSAGTWRIDNVLINASVVPNLTYNFYDANPNPGPATLLAGGVASYDPMTTVGTSPETIYVSSLDQNNCESTAIPVTVTVTAAPDAGTNGSITFCTDGTPMDLYDQLGGLPDVPGTWSGPSPLDNGSSGTYNPLFDDPGVYTYTVAGSGGCPDATATVTVTEIVCVTCDPPTAVACYSPGLTSMTTSWTAPATLPTGYIVQTSTDGISWKTADADPWINEIHYDNTGGDMDEGVEIAGPAGKDLSCYSLVFYNGSGGASYATLNLTGSIDDEGDGFGAVFFAQAGVQNGPDGVALVYNGDGGCDCPGSQTVLQFLSYEGSFTATNGPANGQTSTDIGVSETGGTPVGESLQLSGCGNEYSDFGWNSPAPHSRGDLNMGQEVFSIDAPATSMALNNLDPCNNYDVRVASYCCGTGKTSFAQTISNCTVGPDQGLPAMASSPVCFGNTSTLTVQNTQVGVNYELQDFGGNPIGAQVPGNGGTITFTIPVSELPLAGSPHTFFLEAHYCNCELLLNNEIFVEVLPVEDASFTYPATACINGSNPLPSGIVTAGGTFSVDNGASINSSTGELDLSSTTAGQTYIITYTTSGTCPGTATQTINILPISNPACNACMGVTITFSQTVTDEGCPGASDGTITFSGETGGTAPYMYSIDGGMNYQAGASFTGLAAGSYTLRIKDDNDCESADVMVTIAPGVDNIDPTITCPAPITTNNDAGQCGAVVMFNPTISDNCPGATVVCIPASGSLFPIGTTTVNCTVTDASGNTATCSFDVTVNDTEDPTIVCPGPITEANDPGQCGAVVNFTPMINDNCPGATVVCVPASGSLFPIGTSTVNCTVTDASGNTATCSFDVTVNDTEDPTIVCPGPIVTTNAPGQCAGVAIFFPITNDNCPGETVVCVPPSGSLFPVGTTTVTCTVTDASGNTATCSFDVTVNDIQDPTIVCPGPITQDSDPGQCGAVVNFTPTTNDNCPGETVVCVPASGSLFPIGTTMVNCTVTDVSGNTATCSFDVTVNDTEDPTIVCPAPITEVNDPGQCGAVVNFTPMINDNCPGATVVCVPASGSLFPIGTSTVNCTVTDASGNTATCSFDVTVNDTEDPTISCPANVTVNVDPGTCEATGVTLGTPTFNDNCPGTTVSNDAPTSFPAGVTMVTWMATDAAGNTATCTQTVLVNENEDPTISCPANVTVTADAGQCDADAAGVSLGMPTFNDNCPGTTVSNDAPASFPVGTTIVSWTATDAAGNTATCTQTVVVNDGEDPTISCPANVTVTADAGQCDADAAGVSLGMPIFNDNCPGTTVSNDAPASFPVGTTIVSWTATDAAGNTATCTQMVVVNDGEDPTISCPANVTVTADAGQCDADAAGVSLGMPTFNDNCPGTTVSNDAPASFPVGTTIVSWTATDAAGNTATCTQTVVVNDTEDPTISCPANVTVTADAGQCDADAAGVSLGMPTFNDNCPGTTVSNDAPASFPVGTTIVSWTATDAAGNTATCTQMVVVNDGEDPTISCPANVTVTADAGQCDADAAGVSLGMPTFNDNCPGTTVSNDAPASFPVGTTIVSWTATDAAGNTATCTQTVVVNDTEDPTISCPANVTVTADAGQCDADAAGVSLGMPTFNDNCPGTTVSNDAPASFPVGTTIVSWTATDAAGNTATCTQTVVVNDTEDPTIICALPINISADPGQCGAVVTYLSPSVGDNCPGTTVVCVPASGSLFPIGTTTVNCTVTDASGNTASCSFDVTINDTEDPTISCPGPITQNNDPGQCGAVVNFAPSINDNCPGATVVCVPASGSLFPIGTTTVNCTVTDASGNTATCSFDVTINDMEGPTITCPPNLTISVDTLACSASNVDLGMPTIMENCAGLNSPTNNAPAIFPLGSTTVTWMVSDSTGNVSTCQQIVTVIDSIPPAPDGAFEIWEEVARVFDPDFDNSGDFGFAVDISGDYAIIGDPDNEDGGSERGKVFFYERIGGVWTEVLSVQSSDAANGDGFGDDVAIFGNYAMVGAKLEANGLVNSGAVYVFERIGGIWTEMQKLKSSDEEGFDNFGFSISISGEVAIIGASGEDTGGANAGAAYIFERTGGVWSEVIKLQASDKETGDGFGEDVAIDGDYVIVGARLEDSGGTDAGAAYIFEKIGGTWMEVQKLQSSDIESPDWFGNGVSISGQFALVGAPVESTAGSSAGAAYLFERIGGVWTEIQKLIPTALDGFSSLGENVDITENYLVLGARSDDEKFPGSGAAYTYKRLGTGTWVEMNKIFPSNAFQNSLFGTDVAISGKTILVGAGQFTGPGNGYFYSPLWAYPDICMDCNVTVPTATAQDTCAGSLIGTTTDPTSFNSPVVDTIFWSFFDGVNTTVARQRVVVKSDDPPVINGVTTEITEIQKVLASDPEALDRFGNAVAISGDYAAISALGEDSGGNNAGAVYVFERTGEVWNFTQKLLSLDIEATDAFGVSLAMDGNYLLVGARGEDSGGSNAGAAYFFERIAGSWTEMQKVMASDGVAMDLFGISVSLSGNQAVIGAQNHDAGGSNAGAAYIFERIAGVWVEMQKIQAADLSPADQFGGSVSIDGNSLLVGATNAGEPLFSPGAAYFFTKSGGSWTQTQKVNASDPNTIDRFGSAVSLSGNLAIIGARNEDEGGLNAGAAYIFDNLGGTWLEKQKLLASDAEASDGFGFAVSINSSWAIVGSNGEDDAGSNAGAIYIFQNNAGNWTEFQKVFASDAEAGDAFGGAIALTETDFLVSARNEDSAANNAGAAYFSTIQYKLPDLQAECSITVPIPTAVDDCDGIINGMTTDPTSYSTPDTFSVKWTFTDSFGNVAMANQQVIVADTVAPQISCPADITVPNNAGLCSAIVNYTVTSSDNCPGDTVVCIPASGSIFPVGTTTVNCTATDAFGNTATCSFDVTVNDTENPTISCPANVTVNVDPGTCSANNVVLGTATATDNCPGSTVSNNAPASFPVGSTPVTWTATDASGNTATCVQTVVVIDNIDPTISCPADVTVANDPGACEATNVMLGTPTFSDNCPGSTVSNNAPASFPVGTTTVTWTATDASGNTATCTQTVIVNDTQAPVLSCPSNLTVNNDAGICGAIVSYNPPTLTENCPGATVVCSPASGSFFPVGMTTVTCIATDASGNTSSCSFVITVNDTEPPVASCNDITIDLFSDITDYVLTQADIDAMAAGSSDNCGPFSYVITGGQTSFNCDDLGNTFSVTLTFTDNSGNTSTCAANITVADPNSVCNQAPVAICQDITISADGDCQASILPSDVDGGSFDPDGDPITLSLSFSGPFGLGSTPTILTVSDGSLTDECTAMVTVIDTTAPSITCPADVTIECTESTDPAINGSLGLPMATDNCSDPGDIMVSHTDAIIPGACPNAYTITRIWSAIDESGNFSSCTQIIMVEDTQAPVPPAAPADVTVECMADVPAPAFLMAQDNCEGMIVGVSADSITPGLCPNEKTITRTWLFKDGCNNAVTVSQTIVVDDNTAPDAPDLPDLNFQCADDVPLPAGVVTALDNCDGTVVGVLDADTIPGSCVNNFVITRTYFFTDACGNQSSETQTITVNDDTDPEASCPPDVSGLQCGDTPPAAATTIADFLALGGVVGDNCTATGDISISSSDSDNGNTECVSDGIRVITRTYTFTDECGNSTSCDQTFTYDEDTSAPDITCPADESDLDCNYVVPAGATDIASFLALGGTASDNCTATADLSVSYVDNDNMTLSCPGDARVIVRTYTITDACGNSATCDQTFTYEEITTPPVINCPPDLVCLCGNPNNPLLISNWLSSVTASSDCPLSVSITNDYPNGIFTPDCGNAGTQEVTFTATDQCGNVSECTATITFVDNNPPELDCPAPLTIGTDAGVCEADIAAGILSISAFDKCDPNFTVVNNSAYALDNNSADAAGVYPVGNHLITFTATDACGNVSSCSIDLTVVDDELPQISCPSNIQVDAAAGLCGATVYFSMPTYSDNCPGAMLTQVSGMSSGDFFPTGTTVQEYMVIDAAGNSLNCSFTVTVVNTLSSLCSVTGYAPGTPADYGLFLNNLPGVSNPNFEWENGSGTLAVFLDGTATLTGKVINKGDPNVAFDVNILLENEMDWTNWSALGRNYKYNAVNQATALANHPNWTFWELSSSSSLTGSAGSTYDGDVITLSHKPADYSYGFQLGLGANDKDNDYGISGWYYYSGTLGGQSVSGDGDVNGDASCQPNPCGAGIAVAPRVMLEGNFNSTTQLMEDDLRQAGLVPLLEPFSAIGFMHVGGGSETTSATVLNQTGQDAIVDWVVVELRPAGNYGQVAATRSALIQRDGDIVDVDGVSPVSFVDQPEGNYHVVIYHRTHIPVMSVGAFSLLSSAAYLDFADGSVVSYGTDATKTMSGSIEGMYCGDADFNHTISSTDRALLWNNKNQTGYLNVDVDLDGACTASDRSFGWNNRNRTKQF